MTPEFPEGLGRGVPMYTPQFADMFRPHVIGGPAYYEYPESKLQATTENFIEKPNNTFCSIW